jgi:23S rRNA pseudouridine2457 synthase
MTAAVGFPTLRLIRATIGEWGIDGLQPGEYRKITLGAEFKCYTSVPKPPRPRTKAKSPPRARRKRSP